MTLSTIIENAYQNRDLLKDEQVKQKVYEAIELLDKGQIRVAEYDAASD